MLSHAFDRAARFAVAGRAAGAGAALCISLAVLAPAALGARADAAGALKLPAQRTSPTGNFFTLERYVAPTSSKAVAEFEMKVCTSAHTPAGTAIDPALFTLSLSSGAPAPESPALATSPAIVPKPLKALQCTEGWLGFSVAKGRTAVKLEYDYNGEISWTVG